MVPCPDLVTHVMMDNSKHPLTDKPLVGIRAAPGQGATSRCLRQGRATPATEAVQGPELPKRSQLVLGIVDPFRKLQALDPGRLKLGRRPPGVDQRRRKRRIKLHAAQCVPTRFEVEDCERLPDPGSAL